MAILNYQRVLEKTILYNFTDQPRLGPLSWFFQARSTTESWESVPHFKDVGWSQWAFHTIWVCVCETVFCFWRTQNRNGEDNNWRGFGATVTYFWTARMFKGQPACSGTKTTNDVRQQALLIPLNPHRNHPAVAKSLRIYGGFLSHGGTPKSSKSSDHGLVLKPMAMVTWGSLILRTPYISYVLCTYL